LKLSKSDLSRDHDALRSVALLWPHLVHAHRCSKSPDASGRQRMTSGASAIGARMRETSKTISRTKYRWRVSLMTATPAKSVDFTLAPDA
jgi:hypothetical protein